MIAELKRNQELIENAQKLMLDGRLDLTGYYPIKNKYEVVIKGLESEIKPQTIKSTDYK